MGLIAGVPATNASAEARRDTVLASNRHGFIIFRYQNTGLCLFVGYNSLSEQCAVAAEARCHPRPRISFLAGRFHTRSEAEDFAPAAFLYC